MSLTERLKLGSELKSTLSIGKTPVVRGHAHCWVLNWRTEEASCSKDLWHKYTQRWLV